MQRLLVLFFVLVAGALGAQPAANPCMLVQRQLTLESSQACFAKLYARDSSVVIVLGDVDAVLRPQFEEVLHLERPRRGDTTVLNAHLVKFDCNADEGLRSASMTVAANAATLLTKRGWSDTIVVAVTEPGIEQPVQEAQGGFPYEVIIFSAAALAITALFFFVRSH